MHELHCVADEKAVDLEEVCQLVLGSSPTNDNYIPLYFDIVAEDGGRYSSTYSIENVLKNDGTVYCSERRGTMNILLQYKGWLGNHNQKQKSCALSHIILKSPQYGYTAPFKDGMIFLSHEPIDIEKTRRFDTFTKQDYKRYRKQNSNNNSNGIEPTAFFSAGHSRQAIINMRSRSTRYVLIKLLRADHESENMDVQYIGFVGYTGARAFIDERLF
ncbi:hypothetical protein K501DRAFT_180308 [Backusella circina FSU 941]|nr:hypothetical protein K501DRAFT_180308 [Backusella circina FSU 941]